MGVINMWKYLILSNCSLKHQIFHKRVDFLHPMHQSKQWFSIWDGWARVSSSYMSAHANFRLGKVLLYHKLMICSLNLSWRLTHNPPSVLNMVLNIGRCRFISHIIPYQILRYPIKIYRTILVWYCEYFRYWPYVMPIVVDFDTVNDQHDTDSNILKLGF